MKLQSQRCPSCGVVEAAGAYCTACLTRTGESDYFTAPTGRHAGHAADTDAKRPVSPESGSGHHPHPDEGTEDQRIASFLARHAGTFEDAAGGFAREVAAAVLFARRMATR